MKRISNRTNIRIFKFFDQKNMGSIPRTFLSSLIIIFIFYTSPILIDIAKQNDQEFKNKSKAVLAYTLNSETGNIGNDKWNS